MSNTIKLEFDDGYKTIELNNDPNKVIRFNPTDAKFIKKISNVDETIDKINKKYGNIDINSISELQNLNSENPEFEKIKLASKNMEELEKSMREFINDIFGYDVCSIVFGDDWCISPAGGQPMYINFLDCIAKYIIAESEKLKGEKQAKTINIDTAKTDKYINPIVGVSSTVPITKSPTATIPDISKLTAEQKAAMFDEMMGQKK